MNVCACMGPMYDEPYCYCGMKSRGLDMENNPIRKRDEAQSKLDWEKLFQPGGFFYNLERENKND